MEALLQDLKLAVRQLAKSPAFTAVVVLVFACAATRALASMLFGIEPWDAPTFVATALLLAAVALFATWLPARRATRVDPLEALRTE